MHAKSPWVLLLVGGLLVLLAPTPCGAQEEPRPDLLRVIGGFRSEVYANVPYARSLISIKKGKATITYAGSRLGWGDALSDVWAIVDTDSDGKPEYTWQLVKDLNTPSGIALDEKEDILYVSGWEGAAGAGGKGMIWGLKDVSTAALQKKEYQKADLVVITDKLPSETYHGWRYMRLSAKGDIIIPIGIDCNVCEQRTTDGGFKFGTIYKINPKTGKQTLIADGVRNSVGFDFHPDTGHLWFTDNGRDLLGDNTPDCELNVLTTEGQHFGFPYCSSVGRGNTWRRNLGPGRVFNDPELNPNGTAFDCSDSVKPVQVLGPHVAALGIKFYRWKQGSNFPKSYDRMAFIVQRGSWNRAVKIGYRVTMVKLDTTSDPPKAVMHKDFMWGWLQNKGDLENQYSWGRPADVEQLPDGSLIVSDDTAGMIYRVTRSRNNN